MALVTSKTKAKHDEEFMQKQSGKSKEAADLDLKLLKAKNQQRAANALDNMHEKHLEKNEKKPKEKTYSEQNPYEQEIDAAKASAKAWESSTKAENKSNWNTHHEASLHHQFAHARYSMLGKEYEPIYKNHLDFAKQHKELKSHHDSANPDDTTVMN